MTSTVPSPAARVGERRDRNRARPSPASPCSRANASASARSHARLAGAVGAIVRTNAIDQRRERRRSSRASPCRASTQSTTVTRPRRRDRCQRLARAPRHPAGLCATSKMNRPTLLEAPGNAHVARASRARRRGDVAYGAPAASSIDEREREVRRLMPPDERRAQRRALAAPVERRSVVPSRVDADVARASISSATMRTGDAPAVARARRRAARECVGSRSPITAGTPALEDARLLAGDLLERVAEVLACDRARSTSRRRRAESSTFVESSRPPSPASMTATSAPARAK